MYKFVDQHITDLGYLLIRTTVGETSFSVVEVEFVDVDPPLLLFLEFLDFLASSINVGGNRLVVNNTIWEADLQYRRGHMQIAWSHDELLYT